ncbi:hypothetical protein GMDG_01025 [Pseudogymnoascus destructans 20631-21]|uniref:Uncharacterized protein n=1 Tax=Pseudogymnoascus destructans (strain ATCC MYA-4855 / 20631-21) TaxID=658429 RepID=L8FPN8_PSED2|nr:hypothetical protein GMDG_01025 [Pseudogymnoascus destructans 20631-21]
MAPTEMIQVGLSLRSPRSTTPPSTPPTLSDEDANVVKSLSATQSTPAAPAAAEEVKAEDPPESFQTYKTVNEVWDEKAYKYVIEEQQQPEEKVDGLDRYVFIERRRIIKKTEIPVVYIDIKSKFLRDTLRVILAQAPEISFNEESLSVERNFLFHYLPDLEASRKWNHVDPQDSIIREHIALLIDHIHLSYKETERQGLSNEENKPIEILINSRIMVDAAMFQEINPNYTRPSIFKSTNSIDLWLLGDTTSSNKLDESAMESSVNLDALTDEDLLICSPTVLGFSLNDKLWLEFAVADISGISWNESLFNQLAIPYKSKKLIEALTTSQSSGKTKYTFDDFVEGKGGTILYRADQGCAHST